MHKTNVVGLSLFGFVLAIGCGSSSNTSSPPKTAASSKSTSKTTSSNKPASSTKSTMGMAGNGGEMTTTTTTTMPASGTTFAADDPRGKCGLDSGFPSDDACLLPPDPSEGIQIHVGPSDYNNPDEVNKFVFHPGSEASECWTFHTPNTNDMYYQTYVLSGRAGTHHIIDTMYNVEMMDGGFGVCADPGTGTNANIIDNLPGASKAYMPRGEVASEYADVGRMIPANTPSQADMHYFNYTDKDILREFWLNIYSVPKDQIKRTGSQIRGMGGTSWSFFPIQPGTDMTYSYKCPITQDGVIMALLGHYHSHGKQFTASIQRANGDVEKVFEMYDYLDPASFQYDSVSNNPPFSDNAAGATSGVLSVQAGDQLLWSCHVVNDSMTALRYVNDVKNGEMCNLWGESLGPTLNCVLP